MTFPHDRRLAVIEAQERALAERREREAASATAQAHIRQMQGHGAPLSYRYCPQSGAVCVAAACSGGCSGG